MSFPVLALFAHLLVAQSLGELNPQTNASFEGNLDYFAIGATLAVPYQGTDHGRPDGLACLLPSATVTVPAGALSSRATLRQAYLYYAGNQLQRTGGVTPIDRAVSLQMPGQASPVNITAQPSDIHTVNYFDGNHGSSGTTDAFYSARIDITTLLQQNGTFIGDYTLSGLDTPVCYQFESDCTPGVADADQPSCAPDDVNDNATASFFIVLVYADPALPPRHVTLYDGLQILNSSAPSVTAPLTDLDVAPIPRGQITTYVIEGDIDITGDTESVSAGGRTPVMLGQVVSPAPTQSELETLQCGASSWPNWNDDIFDSSIVGPDTSAECVRGVDVDTFDISSALQSGDTTVDLNLTTTEDNVAVVFAAIGIDVFRPILDVDSRIELIGATNDTAQPKTTITYRIGISNTGNVPATGVEVTDNIPRGLSGLKVITIPAGATDASDPTAGTFQSGLVDVKNITVNPGDILQVLFSAEVTCPISDGAVVRDSGTISNSAEGALGATLFAPDLKISDPNGDICAGRKQPNQPTATLTTVERRLLGGAGCNDAGAPLWMLVALIACARFLFRRRPFFRGRLWLALIALLSCGKGVSPPPPVVTPPSNIPTAPPAPATFPGTACTDPTMVQLPGGTCVDRFETVVTGALGNADQSSGIDGSTTGTASVTYGKVPTAGVSYYQAKALCQNSGKRLCTDTEWEQACRGPSQALYPYGDTFEPAVCNGFDANIAQAVESGAMTECLSDFGTYDMSGNLAEWVEADIPLVGGAGKEIRGGSFVGNSSGLACSTQVGELPDTVDPRAGIRCCK